MLPCILLVDCWHKLDQTSACSSTRLCMSVTSVVTSSTSLIALALSAWAVWNGSQPTIFEVPPVPSGAAFNCECSCPTGTSTFLIPEGRSNFFVIAGYLFVVVLSFLCGLRFGRNAAGNYSIESSDYEGMLSVSGLRCGGGTLA